MRLFALGVNHRTATVPLRERLASSQAAVDALLMRWRAEDPGVEVTRLSTCNRFELYLAAPADSALDGPRLQRDLEHDLALGTDDARALYLFEDEDAARHLFRVTASLDSQVLGEDQIQAQVKQGYAAAVEGNETGPVLNHLFHRALAVGKRIRTETDIARSPVSVATAGVALARRVFGDLGSCRVLVLGVGEMAQLALRHLRDRGARDFLIANRTLARAQAVAEDFGGSALALDEVATHLAGVDLVVAATGAPDPVLQARDVAPRLVGRVDPLLLVDLGLPRNLDPAIDALDGALLYGLDDLEQVTDRSRAERQRAATRGEEIADEAGRAFAGWLATRKVAPVIQELLETSREAARRELTRALRGIDLDDAARVACEQAVLAAVNKVLHQPLVSLRGLPRGADGESTLRVVRDLFRLDKVSGS